MKLKPIKPTFRLDPNMLIRGVSNDCMVPDSHCYDCPLGHRRNPALPTSPCKVAVRFGMLLKKLYIKPYR